MSTINNVNDITQNLALNNATDAKARTELGQDAFMQLLVTQMKHQNPLEPQENGEFIAQMAQFGTVDGIQQLQDSFNALSGSLMSNQALTASTLVGRSVLVPSNTASLESNKSLTGAIKVTEAAKDITVNILNGNGELVKQLSLGDRNQGDIKFEWDGMDNAGDKSPTGTYLIQATGLVGGQRNSLSTMMSANVDSVVIDPQSQKLNLNVSGIGLMPLSDVTHIQ